MPFRQRRQVGIVCATLALIGLVAGADQGGARALVVLRPGSPDLNVSHIRERSDSIQFLVPDSAHPGTEKVTGGSRAIEHLIDHPRGPALLLISQSRGYIDSAIVLRSSLRPISEVQNYLTRHRRLVYEYDGNRVRVRDSTQDSAVKVREHVYDGDVFNFNELDLVLRSVPLRAGYEAILPLYSEGSDTIEMDTVKVLGKDDHGAWSVRFADPVVFMVNTIDGATRSLSSRIGTNRSRGTSGRSVVVK